MPCRPSAVSNEQSLVGKAREHERKSSFVVGVMKRRRMNILCLQEIKWTSGPEKVLYVYSWGIRACSAMYDLMTHLRRHVSFPLNFNVLKLA